MCENSEYSTLPRTTSVPNVVPIHITQNKSDQVRTWYDVLVLESNKNVPVGREIYPGDFEISESHAHYKVTSDARTTVL